jgi:drug/metabolite transporter (DMT)-like permease
MRHSSLSLSHKTARHNMLQTARKAHSFTASRSWAILALVSANVIWGTTFVATKPMLDRIPPVTLATGRFAIGLLVLLPLLAWSHQRPILNRTTAVMGFVGILIAYGCQNLGLGYTGAANAAIIHGGVPLFTILIAALTLGEQLSGGRVAGITLSLIGVAAVVLSNPADALELSVIGDGLILLSAVALAAYLVLGRRAFSGQNPLALVTGVMVFGLLYLLPVSAIEVGVRGMERPTTGDLLGMLYLGAAASALAFVLWAYGLQHMEAGQAATFSNVKIFVGVVVAALVLNESVSWLQRIGGLVIIGGVWLAARPTVQTAPLIKTDSSMDSTVVKRAGVV